MAWAQEPGYSSRRAVEGLREARRLLRRPEAAALEASIPHLEPAIRHLTALENRLRGDPLALPDRLQVRSEIHQIQREMRHVNALMESAGRFYAGLGQLLAAAGDAATYTPQGQLEGQVSRPRLQVEG
jgi:hypothetical protein